MMKNKIVPVLLYILVAILTIFAVFFISTNIALKNILSSAKSVTVTTPDLTFIQDGNYTGEYTLTPVYVKLNVAVTNHKIEHIDILEHKCGKGKPAQTITSNVITKQTLNVDVVSGATVSSKCILKAIETALLTK